MWRRKVCLRALMGVAAAAAFAGVDVADADALPIAGADVATLAQSGEVLHELGISEPRAFGHFIGDLLVRRIDFELRYPFALAPQDGVPKRGRSNPWVELVDSRASFTETAAGRQYHLELTYQLVNSPPEPRLITVPGADLRVVGEGKRFDEHLPDWLLSVAPLTGTDLRIGLEERRPSRGPRAIDMRGPATRAALFGAGGLLLGAWFCIERWGFLILRPLAGRFAQACTSLRRIAREPAAPERDRSALRIIHRAFDDIAGERVFAERLEGFFAHHPEFVAGRAEVQDFFELSRAEFFGHGRNTDVSIASLLRLCEHLRSLETVPGRRHARTV